MNIHYLFKKLLFTLFAEIFQRKEHWLVKFFSKLYLLMRLQQKKNLVYKLNLNTIEQYL